MIGIDFQFKKIIKNTFLLENSKTINLNFYPGKINDSEKYTLGIIINFTLLYILREIRRNNNISLFQI
jgi:hypothetical protein